MAMLLVISWFVAVLFSGQSAATASSQGTALSQAQAQLAAGQFTEAQHAFEAILDQEPQNGAAQQGAINASEKLALAARAQGDNSSALSILIAAKHYAPANPRLLFDLAVLEDGMRLWRDADKTVGALEATNAGSAPQVLYLAARIKLDLGQLDAAAAKMRAYLKLQPNDATAHYGMGRILQMGQQPDAARKEFEESLALAPKQTESQFQLGEIDLSQNQFDSAIAEYAKTIAKNPNHAGALAGTGIAQFRLKQYAKAQQSLRSAILADPAYEPAHYYLGLTLARMGKKAEAAKELAAASKMAAAENKSDSQHLLLQQGGGQPHP